VLTVTLCVDVVCSLCLCGGLQAIMVLMAAYSLGWMQFKRDTLLYSTFNPNWEDRKRK
jgi:hypothetical protein